MWHGYIKRDEITSTYLEECRQSNEFIHLFPLPDFSLKIVNFNMKHDTAPVKMERTQEFVPFLTKRKCYYNFALE